MSAAVRSVLEFMKQHPLEENEQVRRNVRAIRAMLRDKPVLTKEIVEPSGLNFTIDTVLRGEPLEVTRIVDVPGIVQVLYVKVPDTDARVKNHTHPISEETLFVITGKLLIAKDGNGHETHHLLPEQQITLEIGAPHSAYLTAGTTCVAVLIPPDEGYASAEPG